MRLYVLLIVLILFAVTSNSQTLFSPLLGVEYSRISPGTMSNGEIRPYPDINTGSYTSFQHDLYSLIGGIAINHFIKEKLYLSSEFSFSKKKIRVITHPFGGVSYSYTRYDQIQSWLMMNYNIHNRIWGGLGISYSRIYNFRDNNPHPLNRKNEFGASASISYHLNHFVIDMKYNHGFIIKQPQNEYITIFINPTKSLSLTIRYLFQVSDLLRIGSKQENCPEF